MVLSRVGEQYKLFSGLPADYEHAPSDMTRNEQVKSHAPFQY